MSPPLIVTPASRVQDASAVAGVVAGSPAQCTDSSSHFEAYEYMMVAVAVYDTCGWCVCVSTERVY
jgi:hypothetical protein